MDRVDLVDLVELFEWCDGSGGSRNDEGVFVSWAGGLVRRVGEQENHRKVNR